MLRGAARQGLPAALLLLDLDHFKQINDGHGHQAGDRVLRAFARRAARALPSGALLGRVGGEEFAALLTDASADSALSIAENIRQAIATIEFKERGMPRQLSVSIGVASDRKSIGDLDDLLMRADHALYDAKSAGRNCVQHYHARPAPPLRAA